MKDFIFIKTEGGVSLQKYKGKDKIVVIPDTFEGEPVVKIEEYAFHENTILREVTIPGSVLSIDSSAFSGAILLEKINFCEGLKSIGAHGFLCTYKLKEIKLPKSLEEVGNAAFGYCSSLVKAEILNDKTKFIKEPFFNDNNLVELSTSAFADLQFNYLYKLSLIYISKFTQLSLKEQKDITTLIKRRKKLKHLIFFENNFEQIAILLDGHITLTLDEVELFLKESIKNEFTQVTAILLEYKNINFKPDELEIYNENKELVEIGLELPTLKQLKEKWNVGKVEGGLSITGYKGDNTSEVIPETIADGTKIVRIAHSNTKNFEPIEELIIEAKIETFGRGTFKNCKTLTEITLPDSLKDLGENAFTNCTNLRKVNIPEGVTTLKNEAFAFCENLIEIEIPDTVTSFTCFERNYSTGVFTGCTKLKKVILPANFPEIYDFTFKDCLSLTEIVLPKNLTIIGKAAFFNCSNLLKFEIPKTVEKIRDKAFYSCDKFADKQGFIIINSTLVDYIGRETDITIPDTVETIYHIALVRRGVKSIIAPEKFKKNFFNK